jgi:hypothetical protein
MSGDSANGNSGSTVIGTGQAPLGNRGILIFNSARVEGSDVAEFVIGSNSAFNFYSGFNSYYNGGPTPFLALSPTGNEYCIIGTFDQTVGAVKQNIAFQTGANQVASSGVGTGDLAQFTGDITHAASTGKTGQLDQYTGYNYGTGDSGDLNQQTGNCVSGISGHYLAGSGSGGTTQFAQLSTGNASAGPSGDVHLYTGTATGTRGKIDISARVVDFNQVASERFVLHSGATGSRPSSPVVAECWYDTTLLIPIWYNGTNWTNAVGAVV